MMMVAITAKHKKENQTFGAMVANGRHHFHIPNVAGFAGRANSICVFDACDDNRVYYFEFYLMRRSREKVTWADIYGPTSPHSWTDRMMAAFAVVVAFMVMIWAAFELCRWLLQYFL